MNKLVGTCNRELPFVKQLIQTTQLDESLNQREFALDNKLRLIYKWNEVNGLDTQFNLQFTNSRELLFLAQEARINSLPQPTARQEVKQKFYYAELRQEMLSTIRLAIVHSTLIGLALLIKICYLLHCILQVYFLQKVVLL